jgi:hypothetical protein
LLKIGVLPDEFVLWNAFPWHSFDPRRGLLSNRMPNKSEQLSGRPVLKDFLELFPCAQIVALGKIAGTQLEQLGVNSPCIRHPGSGGAKLFRQQIAFVLSKLNLGLAAHACPNRFTPVQGFAENSAINKKAAPELSGAALTLFC